MPKIIEDIKNTILNEAKRQAIENGYSTMTIRSVAKECNIAVGTIYNYYPSKDVLAASFMLDDWLCELNKMRKECEKASNSKGIIKAIYNGILSYSKKYNAIFVDNAATKSSANVFYERHIQLRSQISALIKEFMVKLGKFDDDFLYDFLAESLLAWTATDKSFEQIDCILERLL